MTIHAGAYKGLMVIEISGPLTQASLSTLLAEVNGALLNVGDRVVIALDKVTLLDSGGLRALMKGYKSARDAGASLELAQLSEAADETLTLSGLRPVFLIHDSLDAAAAAKSR